MATGYQGSYATMPLLTTGLNGRLGGVSYMPQSTPYLNTTFVMAFRQQMDKSKLELVHNLTQQMGVIFNPMVDQIGRMLESFGVQPVQTRHRPLESNDDLPLGNQEHPFRLRVVEPVTYEDEEIIEQCEPRPVLVRRCQNVDRVLRNASNMLGRNNITNVVEEVLVCNGLNVGFHKPNYPSPLPNYIRQEEIPKGCKVPKFTKFAGETNESTIEHLARYETKASSLTKNAFTWFTTLVPNSIRTWKQLERAFHEQFFMGQSKIILK
ncbi:uncharacterized protein LOC131658950 [Vicia villosa]|uniref:uncharacterized protein LOC131658950 n=1 Tax=Vicia villosa TaxID=3911 RepID=UPI00273C6395|nr:uncharacterized protein LOC131658950 [Vicia villosa]